MYRLRDERLETSPNKRDHRIIELLRFEGIYLVPIPRALVESELNLSHQCALAAKRASLMPQGAAGPTSLQPLHYNLLIRDVLVLHSFFISDNVLSYITALLSLAR